MSSKDYNSDKHYEDRFDYEGARRDLRDSGLDPDYLPNRDREERDRFMREHRLDPKKYGSRYTGSDSSGHSDSGCFLTTACIAAENLPDDCDELQTLRNYRDYYLKNRENGQQDIQEYYETAPQIVKSIDELPDRIEIWKSLYENMVVPCVQLIKEKKNEEAYKLYKEATLDLKEKYLNV